MARPCAAWCDANPGPPRARHRARVGANALVGVAPGTILPIDAPDAIRIATGDGVLEVLELQAEGGKVLPANAFLAGHPLTAGERLGTP